MSAGSYQVRRGWDNLGVCTWIDRLPLGDGGMRAMNRPCSQVKSPVEQLMSAPLP